MKRLFREAGVLTWLFAAAALCAIVVSITTVALADILGRALSSIMRGAPFETTWLVVRLGIVLGVIAVLSVFARKLLSSQFSERLQARLRQRIAARLTHATATAIHAMHSGEIISRMSSDMVLTEQLVKNDALQFVVQTLTAVLAATYMLTHNWFLTLVSIAGTPVLLLVASALTKPLGPLSAASQSALGQASVTAQEAITGAEVVRALNMNGVLLATREQSRPVVASEDRFRSSSCETLFRRHGTIADSFRGRLLCRGLHGADRPTRVWTAHRVRPTH